MIVPISLSFFVLAQMWFLILAHDYQWGMIWPTCTHFFLVWGQLFISFCLNTIICLQWIYPMMHVGWVEPICVWTLLYHMFGIFVYLIVTLAQPSSCMIHLGSDGWLWIPMGMIQCLTCIVPGLQYYLL